MKPIIIEMDEMTDSAQIYHANIHPVVIRLIYIVLGLMCAAILWMYFSRLETVIKAQGQMVYRETDGDGALMHVTSDVGGTYYAEIYIKAADISSLKKIRKAKGITQKELAELSGASLRMIQLYEQKQQDISKAETQTLLNISKVLGCSVNALLN